VAGGRSMQVDQCCYCIVILMGGLRGGGKVIVLPLADMV
jgi:hypothetical protein